MRPIIRRLAPLAILASAILLPASASATATSKQIKAATTVGATYLKSLQLEDGGFESDWSLGGLAAAGDAAASVKSPGASTDARSWYRALIGDPDTWPGGSDPSVSNFERAALNGYAAGIDPARVSKRQNLIAQIVAQYDTEQPGYYGSTSSLTGTFFGLLALADTSVTVHRRVPEALLEKSVTALEANQHSDGGWTYETAEGEPAALAEPSEPDETGAAIAGLCAAGLTSTSTTVAKAVAYLKADLDPDGAFESPYGQNTDSTAWAVQGLDACKVNPQGSEFTSSSGATPLSFLISQQVEGGGFIYEPGEEFGPNEYSSQDAIHALAGDSFTAKPPSVHGGTRVLAETGFASGTASLLTVVVDTGAAVHPCSVSISPAGATTTLQAVLEAAQAASTPSGCVTSFATIGGNSPITQIDGSPEPGAPNWKLSIDGGPEKEAKASAKIALGDTLYLRLS